MLFCIVDVSVLLLYSSVPKRNHRDPLQYNYLVGLRLLVQRSSRQVLAFRGGLVFKIDKRNTHLYHDLMKKEMNSGVILCDAEKM